MYLYNNLFYSFIIWFYYGILRDIFQKISNFVKENVFFFSLLQQIFGYILKQIFQNIYNQIIFKSENLFYFFFFFFCSLISLIVYFLNFFILFLKIKKFSILTPFS